MAKTIFATTEEKNISEDGVYEQNQVDRRATYLRGDERSFMTRWVYKYLKYPREAVDRGIQGRVVIEFIVEKTGEITNVQVVRSVDELLDQEAIKVISASPKWRPATIEERPVRVKTSVPVEFKLTKDRSIRLKK